MKKLILITLALCSLPTQAESVYACKDASGHVVYRQFKTGNCERMTIPSNPINATYESSPRVDTPDVTLPIYDTPNVQTSKQKSEALIAAEKELEEAKAIRYGNERNYAKYLERIRPLEEKVEQLGGTVKKEKQ